MKCIHTLPATTTEACVATIGFFDGVHRGHRCLIDQVKREAERQGIKSLALTFPEHPRCVMQADYQPKLLTTPDEKLELLAATGIDYCAVLPFTRELSQYTARHFMESVLRDQFNVKTLLIGYDHRFGKKSEETFDEYVVYGRELGVEVVQAKELEDEAMHVSSSAIRKALQEGYIKRATYGLGYPYTLQGVVVSGRQVGRKIGFPTANLKLADAHKLIPQTGVYAVRVQLGEQTHDAMLNIGRRPTLNNGNDCTIEAHLLHFNGNLYGETIRITFIDRLRNEQQFSSLEELTEQLHRDAKQTEILLHS